MEWNEMEREKKEKQRQIVLQLLDASSRLPYNFTAFFRRSNEFAGVQQQTLVMPAKLGKKRGPNSVLGVCVSEGKSDCVC